jgi:hypothetical protein
MPAVAQTTGVAEYTALADEAIEALNKVTL